MNKTTLAIMLVSSLAGCAGRGGGLLQRATINHPMTTGGVTSGPTLSFEETDEEHHLGIQPGALTDNATLARADGEQVCVDVTLRVAEDDMRWASLSSYLIQILSSDAEAPVENPLVSERAVQSFALPGERSEQIPTGGMRSYCSQHDGHGGCMEYRTEPLMRSIRVPTMRTVHEGGGTVCWANAGILTPHTTWLRVRFVDPANPGGRRGRMMRRGRLGLNYEWQLAGAQPIAQNQSEE